MPASVFSSVWQIGSNLDSLFTSIDAFLNKENYYSTKDVEVINAARKLFAECFPNQPMPRELRYAHEPKEEEGTHIDASPEAPTNAHFQPPYVLFDEKKQYSVTQVESKLGKNELRTFCENSIKDIHGYLNALNQKSAGWSNKVPGYDYGIFSDSSRFICLLIRNAFVVFSALELRDRSVSEQAETYIDFLTRLVHDQVICQIFATRTMIEGYGNPLAVINTARQNLTNIDGLIKHYRSKFGILEYASALKSNVTNFIDVSHLFSVYILSNIEMNETHTKTECRSSSSVTDKTSALEVFRISFANALVSEGTSRVKAIENKSNVHLSAHFNFDTRLKTWHWNSKYELTAENSGVYVQFRTNSKLMTDFYQFCSLLKLLSATQKELIGLENILRAGGNIFAAFYFSNKIEITLVTLCQLLEEMDQSYKCIMSVAEIEHNRLVNQGKGISVEETTWLNNFRHLNNLLHAKKSITKLKEALLNNIFDVRRVLTSWNENPENKIEEFKQEIANFVREQRATTYILAQTNDKYADAIKALESTEHVLPLMQDAFSQETVAAITASKPVLLMSSSYSLLQQVQEKLTAYAKKSGYAFKIPEVDSSIRLPDHAPQHWGFTAQVSSPELHTDRIQWMFSFFSALVFETDEGRKLEGLKDRITSKKSKPYFKPLHTGDTFLEIMDQIEESLQTHLLGLNANQVASTGAIAMPHHGRLFVNGAIRRKAQVEEIEDAAPAAVSASQTKPATSRNPSSVTRELAPPQASSALALIRNPLYGNRHLNPAGMRPAQAMSDTNKVTFVSHLQTMMNGFSRKPSDDLGRVQFLAFWRELCCLNENMRKFHAEHLHERRVLTHSIKYLEGINKGLNGTEVQQRLGMVALRLLEPKKEVKPDQELALIVRDSPSSLVNARESLEDRTELTYRRLVAIETSAYRYQIQHLGMEGYTLCLIQPGMDLSTIKKGEIYIEPKGNTIDYTVITPQENRVTASIPLNEFIEPLDLSKFQQPFQLTDLEPYLLPILKITTERNHTQVGAEVWNASRRDGLQQELVRLSSLPNESIAEMLAKISACLLQMERMDAADENLALDRCLQRALAEHSKTETDEEKSYWAWMIRGLLALGANPLVWMNAQSNNEAMLANERTFYLMVEQTGLILSHLEYQAKHLGETAVFLREKLEALFVQVRLFAERLYDCVDSEDKSHFRNWILKISSTYNRARTERAAIFLAALNWIYVFLNEDQLIDPQTKTRLPVLEKAENFLQLTVRKYEEKVGAGSWFINDGYNSWICLCAAVKDIKEAMVTLGALRGTQMVSEKNSELERQLDSAKQKGEKAVSSLSNAVRKLLMLKMNEHLLPHSFATVDGFHLQMGRVIIEVQELFDQEKKETLQTLLSEIINADPRFAHLVQFISPYPAPPMPEATFSAGGVFFEGETNPILATSLSKGGSALRT